MERLPPSEQDRVERDPVCGGTVDVQVALHVEYEHRLYYFHSYECLRAFLQDPERYHGRRPPPGVAPPAER